MNTVKGYVYVITNKATPGLCKVGHTLKDPLLRAKELETAGSIYPFVVSYQALVYNPRLVEQKTHKLLSCYHVNKEWFKCSVQICINAILQSSEGILYYNTNINNVENKELNQKKPISEPSRHKLYFMSKLKKKAQEKSASATDVVLPKTPPPSRHKQYFMRRLAEKKLIEVDQSINVSISNEDLQKHEASNFQTLSPIEKLSLSASSIETHEASASSTRAKTSSPPSRHKQYFMRRLAEKKLIEVDQSINVSISNEDLQKHEDSNLQTLSPIEKLSLSASNIETREASASSTRAKTSSPPSRHKQYFMRRLAEKQLESIDVDNKNQISQKTAQKLSTNTSQKIELSAKASSGHCLNSPPLDCAPREKNHATCHKKIDSEPEIILTEIVETPSPQKNQQQQRGSHDQQPNDTTDKGVWDWLLKLISAFP